MIPMPIFIEITGASGNCKSLELVPVYRENKEQIIPAASIRLFEGFDTDFWEDEAIIGIEQYLDNTDMHTIDAPHYVGTLVFTGVGLLEWSYEGDSLSEDELLQIIDQLWSLSSGRIYIEPARAA